MRKIGGERFERIVRYTLPPEKPLAVGIAEQTDAFGDPIEPPDYVPVYVEGVPF